ncbi:MAG: hypothetical protein KKH20_06785 [Proteobacteria bacterium]|nr:hypothetical protein [Pseudomonadota bacterium]MBU4101067.1 hypothetical protein [Pseudomonadota bacterium]MBU4127542.1 hypothetical protein [Pseudomonadota bacterium]
MKTFVNVYKQKRRWAWGVENFPIVMRGFLLARNISLKKKMKHGFKLLERHINWATWLFLLSIVSWLPALFGDREFFSTTVYYSAPQTVPCTAFHLVRTKSLDFLHRLYNVCPTEANRPIPVSGRMKTITTWRNKRSSGKRTAAMTR